MISVGIFFITSADSASIVMASLAEKGNPAPRRWNTVVWGLSLAVIAAVLLVGGGSAALTGLQNLMMVTALPFAVVIVLVMISWAKELSRDPQTIRRRFTREALFQGVRAGIAEHGDDFVIGVVPAHPDKGAGAWLDTDDPGLTQWYSPGSAQEPLAATEPATEPAAEPAAPHDDAAGDEPDITAGTTDDTTEGDAT
jgi:hypothetical protein